METQNNARLGIDFMILLHGLGSDSAANANSESLAPNYKILRILSNFGWGICKNRCCVIGSVQIVD